MKRIYSKILFICLSLAFLFACPATAQTAAADGRWMEQGNASFQAGRYTDAVSACTKAIEQNPNDAQAYKVRGDAHAALGRYRQALRDYTKAIELQPEDAQAYEQRGNVQASLGNYEQSKKDLDKAEELKPKMASAHLLKGIEYEKLGEWEAAITELQKRSLLIRGWLSPTTTAKSPIGRRGNTKTR